LGFLLTEGPPFGSIRGRWWADRREAPHAKPYSSVPGEVKPECRSHCRRKKS
jgi:hypothetical protein